jgi:hypothetical protein
MRLNTGRVCVTFCRKILKMATETYTLMQIPFGGAIRSEHYFLSGSDVLRRDEYPSKVTIRGRRNIHHGLVAIVRESVT